MVKRLETKATKFTKKCYVDGNGTDVLKRWSYSTNLEAEKLPQLRLKGCKSQSATCRTILLIWSAST